MRFVDTNILLYAFTRHPGEEHKAEVAASLLRESDLALSAQVLQEFYVQATRASRPDPLRHDQAVRICRSLTRYPVQPITLEIVQAAFATRARWQVSYWDAAILEAARSLRCKVVLSKDRAAGQDYGGIVVENPF